MAGNTCFSSESYGWSQHQPSKTINYKIFSLLRVTIKSVSCVAGYIHFLLHLTKWFIIAISL